jgi:hypothetical protein
MSRPDTNIDICMHTEQSKGRKADERSFVYGIACERAITDLDLASAIFNCDASEGSRGCEGRKVRERFESLCDSFASWGLIYVHFLKYKSIL